MTLSEGFKKWLTHIGVGVIALLIGVGVGRYTAPVKVIESERIVYKAESKAEVKKDTNEAVKEAIKDNSNTKTKYVNIYIKKPSGEVMIIREKDTETQAALDTLKESIKKEALVAKQETKAEAVKETKKEIVYQRDNWLLSAKVGSKLDEIHFTNPASSLVFGAELKYRIVGPVWLGVGASTNKEVFITGGISF